MSEETKKELQEMIDVYEEERLNLQGIFDNLAQDDLEQREYYKGRIHQLKYVISGMNNLIK